MVWAVVSSLLRHDRPKSDSSFNDEAENTPSQGDAQDEPHNHAARASRDWFHITSFQLIFAISGEISGKIVWRERERERERKKKEIYSERRCL